MSNRKKKNSHPADNNVPVQNENPAENPVEIKDALMDALKIQDYKIKFMADKGLESCLRITLGRKEQTQTVVSTILNVYKKSI